MCLNDVIVPGITIAPSIYEVVPIIAPVHCAIVPDIVSTRAHTNLSNDQTVKDDTYWRKNVYKFGKDIKEIFSSVATSLSKIKLKSKTTLLEGEEDAEPKAHNLNSTIYVGNSGSISVRKKIFFFVRYKKNYEMNNAGIYIFIGTMLL
jgi:hypothetical protein